jgi:hypothetical protein
MTTVIAVLVGIAAVIAIELLGSAAMKAQRSRKSWTSLAAARKEIDNDLDLIAAKKRHPAGKGRR